MVFVLLSIGMSSTALYSPPHFGDITLPLSKRTHTDPDMTNTFQINRGLRLARTLLLQIAFRAPSGCGVTWDRISTLSRLKYTMCSHLLLPFDIDNPHVWCRLSYVTSLSDSCQISDLSIRYHIYDYTSWYDSRTTTAWVRWNRCALNGLPKWPLVPASISRPNAGPR